MALLPMKPETLIGPCESELELVDVREFGKGFVHLHYRKI
jgi:hypothetical protein